MTPPMRTCVLELLFFLFLGVRDPPVKASCGTPVGGVRNHPRGGYGPPLYSSPLPRAKFQNFARRRAHPIWGPQVNGLPYFGTYVCTCMHVLL